jgi:hypothetical protein
MECKSFVLALIAILLLTVAAESKKKTEDDFNVFFTVTGIFSSSSVLSRYCVMNLTTGSVAYSIHASYWNCATFQVRSQVKGKFDTSGIHAGNIELMYYSDKGKLKSDWYIVDSQVAAP